MKRFGRERGDNLMTPEFIQPPAASEPEGPAGPVIEPLTVTGPQTKLVYRSFNPSDPCSDSADTIIYQNNPAYAEGMHVCAAGAYVPLTLGPTRTESAVRLQFAANLPITATGVAGVLSWDTENFDTDNMHDGTSPTRITIRTAGKYLVAAGIVFETANNLGSRVSQITLNGVAVPVAVGRYQPFANTILPLICGTVADFIVGDFLQVTAFQDSGSSMALLGSTTLAALGQALPYFYAIRLN